MRFSYLLLTLLYLVCASVLAEDFCYETPENLFEETHWNPSLTRDQREKATFIADYPTVREIIQKIHELEKYNCDFNLASVDDFQEPANSLGGLPDANQAAVMMAKDHPGKYAKFTLKFTCPKNPIIESEDPEFKSYTIEGKVSRVSQKGVEQCQVIVSKSPISL